MAQKDRLSRQNIIFKPIIKLKTENSTDICIILVNLNIMESKRQRQVAKQIQKDLGEIFQREMKQAFDKAFVTITDVKTTPDLAIARVYLSFLLTKDKEGLLETIREHTKTIRNHLAARVRHQLRIVPDLQFYLDDTAEYAQKIESLFANIVIPPTSKEDDEE